MIDCNEYLLIPDMAEYYNVENDRSEVFIWVVDNYSDVIGAVLNDFQSHPHIDRVNKPLVMAFIMQESAGNPFAIRYEPSFFKWLQKRLNTTDIKKVLKGRVSLKTELVARATSFGPMQVLGQTAREQGFKRPFLSELCVPEEGIYFGIKYLLSRAAINQSKIDMIAAYNSGTPKYTSVAGVRTLMNLQYVLSVEMYEKKFENILYKENTDHA